MMENDFYYRREHQDFVFQGSNLVRKMNGKEVFLFDFAGDYNKKPGFRVLEVLPYRQFFVILLSWALNRNLICIDGNSNSILWRIPPVKQVGVGDDNVWCDLIIKEEQPDVVYCLSMKGYTAAFKIETGEMISERFSRKPDPRDF